VDAAADELHERLRITPRQLADLTGELRAAMQSRVDEIVEIQSSGASSFPVVEFDDVLAGRDAVLERARVYLTERARR